MIMQLKNNCLRKENTREKGFTLIELFIVIAILSVIGITIYTFFTNITAKSTAERMTSQIQQKARMAVDVMVRDIRLMGLDPTGDVDSALFIDSTNESGHGFSDGAGNDHIFIQADLDYDGVIGSSEFEQVGYWFDSATDSVMMLYLGDNSGVLQLTSGVLVDNVTNFELTYRDEDGITVTPNTKGDNVFFVTVDLTVREKKASEGANTGNDSFVERTYSETVRIRNIKE